MHLKQISLQHFRSYTKAQFSFDPRLTIIIGPNASGKTNLVEAIGIISTGKSFRNGKENQVIGFGETIARVKGEVSEALPGGEQVAEVTAIEVLFTEMQGQAFQKKYLVNSIAKRRSSLAGFLPTVLFTPVDLAIVSGQPSDKRRFLDEVLEQTDPQYASALLLYGKALRQRNALLEFVQKSGRRDEERFLYWDTMLITNGQMVTEKREAFITYLNSQKKELFPFTVIYDKSLMSRERLLQYKDAEVGAGMTLVGPQRDDVIINTVHPVSKELEDVKYFCSRGQQRLITLELKKMQIAYLQEQLQMNPLLVLDDIFSELDEEHIGQVLRLANNFQTIITTTHKEFIGDLGEKAAVIELNNK